MKLYPPGGLELVYKLGEGEIHWDNHAKPDGYYKDCPFYLFHQAYKYSSIEFLLLNLIQTKIIPVEILMQFNAQLASEPQLIEEEIIFMFIEDACRLETEALE